MIGGELYRYAFQGQEKDPETGKEAFQLRLWDNRIGRWLTTDPAGQYASPYLGMGNNPISRVDPDGGQDWEPKVNSDGSTSYIKEAHDSAETLQSQFGLSQIEAESLYATMENGVISGQSVFNMFGSEILQLDFQSYMATEQRKFNQFEFGRDHSTTKGEFVSAFQPGKYFSNYGYTQIASGMANMSVDGNIFRIRYNIPLHRVTLDGYTMEAMTTDAVYRNVKGGVTRYFDDTAIIEFDFVHPNTGKTGWPLHFNVHNRNGPSAQSRFSKKFPMYNYMKINTNSFKN